MSAEACPGTCNKRYREAWEEYRRAEAGYDPLDPHTSRPEPPSLEPWPGDPGWCSRCASEILKKFAELDDLAALRMAPADGHAASTAAERVSGSSEEPSPSPAADDVTDLTLDLAAWERDYRDKNGWPAPPHRGDLAHARTGCHAWLLERLRGILASPMGEDFGKEMLSWHRLLSGASKAGVRTLRKPLRCPSCRWLTLFWTEGEKQVYCENPDCGRILSLAEYEAEVERLTAAGHDDGETAVAALAVPRTVGASLLPGASVSCVLLRVDDHARLRAARFPRPPVRRGLYVFQGRRDAFPARHGRAPDRDAGRRSRRGIGPRNRQLAQPRVSPRRDGQPRPGNPRRSRAPLLPAARSPRRRACHGRAVRCRRPEARRTEPERTCRVTVTVLEHDGTHRAQVPDALLPCCEPGHPDPEQAAGHALRLVQAIARKTGHDSG